jgi:tetratricopeptide (TPR) repeat protein
MMTTYRMVAAAATALVAGCLLTTPAVAQPAAQDRLSEKDRREAVDAFRGGMRALASERYDDAERDFKKAVSLDPLYDAAFFGLGQVYVATRRSEQALQAFLDCREAFTKAVAQESLDNTIADRRLRDQIDGLRDYLRIMENPTTRPTTTGLDAARDRTRQQIVQLEGRLARNQTGSVPVPAGVSLAIGSAYFRLNKIADAELEYKAAIATDPSLGEAHSNLAVVYLITRRFDEAQEEVDAAEAAGFKVNPQLKADIRKARGGH